MMICLMKRDRVDVVVGAFADDHVVIVDRMDIREVLLGETPEAVFQEIYPLNGVGHVHHKAVYLSQYHSEAVLHEISPLEGADHVHHKAVYLVLMSRRRPG